MSQTLLAHLRCRPELASDLAQDDPLRRACSLHHGDNGVRNGANGQHQFGSGPERKLHSALQDLLFHGNSIRGPLELDATIDNLRFERYIGRDQQRPFGGNRFIHQLYYAARPFLQTSIRRKIQAFSFRGWKSVRFPAWPVDTSVEHIFGFVMASLLEGNREEPFIWFWPRGATAALMMTHDVETDAGLRFLPRLMDIDDEHKVSASVQLIPEERYSVSEAIRRLICDRGHEVAVQDLNHDGHLFDNEVVFRERVAVINAYGRAWGASGFRAGALYRHQVWTDAFDFEYDMSVPNVGQLEAQRGGCCTVFPYFNGHILELPLTTTQDYTVFNILHQRSTELWAQQIDRIMEHSGLISFIVHPDYVISPREQAVYRELLAIIAELRSSRGVWVARPNEVNRWWRDRSRSRLVRHGETWKIDGPARESATVAYARLQEGRLVYRLEPSELTVQRTPYLVGSEKKMLV